jgi:CRISPR-associated protein Csm1
MSDFDQKEYNSVVLAALLHDVGKFLHRITGIEEFKGTHARLGADFVTGKNEFSENGKHKELNFFSKQIRDEWVYKDRLEESIIKHHSGKETWGWIVHKADSYSTKERFEEGEGVTTYPPKGRIIPLK